MRAFLLLGAAALGLLCALGEDGKTATKPEVTTAPKPGGFQAWAKAEVAKQESRERSEAVQPVKVTPREPETQPEPADDELLIEEPTSSATMPLATCDNPKCRCGPNCQCGPDCRCDGTKLIATSGRLPRLRVTVWDKGCTRCEAFKSGAMAELGWTVGGPESQIEIVTVPGNLESSPPAPLFEYVTSSGVESWAGYTNRDDFMSRLRRAMGLPFEPKEATNRAVSSTNPTVTGDVGWHSHRCVCGTIWSHDGSGEHYAAHTCPSCGRYQNEVYQGQPAMQTRGTYYTPAVRQRGFFGRVFRGGCANGACGR